MRGSADSWWFTSAVDGCEQKARSPLRLPVDGVRVVSVGIDDDVEVEGRPRHVLGTGNRALPEVAPRSASAGGPPEGRCVPCRDKPTQPVKIYTSRENYGYGCCSTITRTRDNADG